MQRFILSTVSAFLLTASVGFAAAPPTVKSRILNQTTLYRSEGKFVATHVAREAKVTVFGSTRSTQPFIERVEIEDHDGVQSYTPAEVPEIHQARVKMLSRLAGVN